MKNKLLSYDKVRYGNNKIPYFQVIFRKYNSSNVMVFKLCYKIVYKLISFLYKNEIPLQTQIGKGLYVGHPFGITINPNAVIGDNCNLHKGVTIGQENRGVKKGCPIIGNEVWIGINSVIVGKITIGDDVLIAANSFVNKDVPSHCIVVGNPCVIISKKEATKEYISNKCKD